ncbi:MAG: DUF502 domain-containing protein [Pseudomonadota bacterium]
MESKSRIAKFRTRVTTGLLVAIPALVTFWVIELTLEFVVASGEPLARVFAGFVRPFSRDLSDLLVSDGTRWAVAISLMLGLFYVLGSIARRMSGRKLLDRVERWVLQLPMMNIVYGSVKELVATLNKQEAFLGQQVVLIAFPHPHMKALGFVTRIFSEVETGKRLAAVYVPTTPNPTSGYVEIVPADDLVWLDWTPQQAMRFVVSGGAIGPDTIPFTASPTPPIEPTPPTDQGNGKLDVAHQ